MKAARLSTEQISHNGAAKILSLCLLEEPANPDRKDALIFPAFRFIAATWTAEPVIAFSIRYVGVTFL
jgi:hypothetical protein